MNCRNTSAIAERARHQFSGIRGLRRPDADNHAGIQAWGVPIGQLRLSSGGEGLDWGRGGGNDSRSCHFSMDFKASDLLSRRFLVRVRAT